MRKRKAFRLVSVFLCAVMVFTSESVSYAVGSVPLEEKEISLYEEESEGSVEMPVETEEPPDIQEDNGEEDSKETNPDDPKDPATGSENEDDFAPDTSGDSDTPEAEAPPTTDDGNAEKEELPTTDDSDAEIEESPVEENPIEEQPPAMEGKKPIGSVSDNSVSANTPESLTTPTELTDFVIVDEGGNILDETQTVYLDRNRTRKFSIKPVPENAVYPDVMWNSDNPRVSVTDGMVRFVPEADDSAENISLTAIITAQTGGIKKSCKVAFMPLIEDVVIVDPDGREVPEEGLIMEMDQQIKLSAKLVPADASADVTIRWESSDSFYVDVDQKGVVTPERPPYELPFKCKITAEITASSMQEKITKKKSIYVTVVESSEKLLCGDIHFFCPEMGTPEKIDDTTWKAGIGKRRSWNRNIVKLSYTGGESKYTIYYTNASRGLSFTESGQISYNAQEYDPKKGIELDPSYPLQVVVEIGYWYEPEKYSAIYTIHFTEYETAFSLDPRTLYTVPAGAEQELTVRKLPDGAKMEDIRWTSSDERLVKIKNRTESGVMLQFGQTVGSAEITASVNDYKGQNCYAACTVNISMQIPSPEFRSESGGEMFEEQTDGDLYDYWMIDKGGALEIFVSSPPGAKIYYTTNGRDPVTQGKLYQSPIVINGRTTIKACAKMSGYQDSEVFEREIRIGNPKISVSPTAVSMPTNSSRSIRAILPSWADPDDVFWESSNDDIAYVDIEDIEDSEGYWIGSRPMIVSNDDGIAGTCTITASYFDYADRVQTATCRVTVRGKLEIVKSITMYEEDTAEIRITKMPPGIPRDEIMWFAVNPDDYSYIDIETAPNGNGLISVGHLPDSSEPCTITIEASADVCVSDDILDFEVASAYCEVTIIPKQYTVRFLGWNDKPAKIESLGRGQNATPPEDAVMRAASPEGYLFDGWQNLNDCKNITKDTDIYAKPYVMKPFHIDYMTGTEGSNPAANPATYLVSDKNLILQDAVPADNTAHKFAGWYRNSRYEGSPIDEIPTGTTGDLTLYAKWIPAKTGLRIEPIEDQPYTGKAIKPEVVVYDGETLLTPGTDYTIAYINNTNAWMDSWSTPRKPPAVIVRGKGNYGGSDTAAFQIIPQNIASEAAEVVVPDLYLAYTGKKLTVTPVLTWNGKKLTNNKDFEITDITNMDLCISVTECIDEGFYTVSIAGKGNFAGTREIPLTITRKTLLNKVSFTPNKLRDIPWADLQGKTLGETDIAVDEGVILKKGGSKLIKDTDYTVTFDTDAKDPGVYTAMFIGMGENYAGVVTKTFKITGTPLKASNLDFGSDWKKDMPYTGTSREQTLHLSYKKDRNTLIELELNKDYTVTYENTTNVGNKATVIITGINGYTGTVKKTYKITPYSLKNAAEITAALADSSDAVPYEKGGAKPKIIVKFGETVLTEGKDYTVTYKNNTKPASKDESKAPAYTVKGKGNFKDSLTEQKFSIAAQDISKLSITAEDVMAAAPNSKKGETVGKTGAGRYKSTPKITDFNGKALSAGTDFKKSYTFTDENGVVLGPKDQVPAGSRLTVTLQGINNYIGKTKVTYRVLAAKRSLKSAGVSLKKDVTKAYDLEPVTLHKEDLIVKLNGKELSPDDYTIVSYVNNRKKGTAKVTIQGVGEYGGTKTVNFSIKARKISWFKTP